MALGNLIQINARGEQERLLYGNPQMTYFKKVYRTSSNFARSYLNIPFSGTADFGSKIHINLPHNGDLLANLYLSMTLPKITQIGASNISGERGSTYYCNGIGYKIIKSISIKFNGVNIENLTGEMMSHIYTLQTNNLDKDTLDKLFHFREYNNYKVQLNSINDDSESAKNILERRGPINLDIPIPFFFSLVPENYLPLCAMSNTNIDIILEFEEVKNLIFGNDESDSTASGTVVDMSTIGSITNFKIISEVINLDSNEKILFTTNNLTYLVKLNNIVASEKISGYTQGNINIDLNAKNAVKMLYFTILPDINERFRDYFNYSIKYLSERKIADAGDNLKDFYSNINRPLLYLSTNNKLIEDISLEIDNNKLFELNLLSLNFLNNISALNKNNIKMTYQLFCYNFNLNSSSEVDGSLNFSRLIKKSMSFKIGSDYKNYLNNNAGFSVSGSTTTEWNNLFTNNFNKLIFKCYSCYYNYLIIKDGLAGLKYN